MKINGKNFFCAKNGHDGKESCAKKDKIGWILENKKYM